MVTEAGIKHDHGKPRASLVVHGFARARPGVRWRGWSWCCGMKINLLGRKAAKISKEFGLVIGQGRKI